MCHSSSYMIDYLRRKIGHNLVHNFIRWLKMLKLCYNSCSGVIWCIFSLPLMLLSAILILNQFWFFDIHPSRQAMWRWLWSSHNGVPKPHRAYLLKRFKSLVYAPSEAALMADYGKLMMDPTAVCHAKFTRHLQQVFERREEWALCLQVCFCHLCKGAEMS